MYDPEEDHLNAADGVLSYSKGILGQGLLFKFSGRISFGILLTPIMLVQFVVLSLLFFFENGNEDHLRLVINLNTMLYT